MPAIHAQNQMDEQGRKTGPWRVEYPNGQTLYEGTFLEGQPVGEMTRYYDNGSLRAKIHFDRELDRSHAKLYHKNGKLAAEGIYAGEDKDSVWTYYSEIDGTPRIRENYISGKIHGKSLRYYPNGEVSEEVSWEMDSREGPWIQYFQGGNVRLRGNYHHDLLSGDYQVFSQDSTLVMSGTYSNGLSEGIWSYYDEEGNLLYTLEYKEGLPLDRKKYMELMQDTLLRYDSTEAIQPAQFF